MSGIKGSVCLSTTDRRVSVTPWLGEPPCDPNPPARPKAFSKYSFDLSLKAEKRLLSDVFAISCLGHKAYHELCGVFVGYCTCNKWCLFLIFV